MQAVFSHVVCDLWFVMRLDTHVLTLPWPQSDAGLRGDDLATRLDLVREQVTAG